MGQSTEALSIVCGLGVMLVILLVVGVLDLLTRTGRR